MKTILLLDKDYEKSKRFNVEAFKKLIKVLDDKKINYDLNIRDYVTVHNDDCVRPPLLEPHSLFGFKIELLYQVLGEYPPDEIILYTDAFDTYFLADQNEILEKFKSFNADIVFGHEKNCWPNLKNEPKFYPNGDFINAGVYMGINSKIRKMMEYCITLNSVRFYDDQHAWLILTKLTRENIKVEVDLNNELVLNLFNFNTNGQEEFDVIEDRLINKKTKAKPCILHANGDVYNDMMLNKMIKSIWI